MKKKVVGGKMGESKMILIDDMAQSTVREWNQV